MLLDKQNIFSDGQTIIATSYSTNSIYFGKNDVSYLPLLVQVVTDFAGLTSLCVEVETSATMSFSSPTVLYSCTLSVDKLTAGARFPISQIPRGNLGYIRLRYIVVGTGTAGKITAGIVAGDSLSWHEQ